MTFRKSILLLISLSMIAALVACSSSKKTPPPAITVSVSPTTANVVVSATQSITATTNDTKGVTWTAACGTVAPTSSLTGVAVVYTAPDAVPTPPTCVITATSVTDTTKTATATFTITTAPPAITVTVSPTTANVMVGATQNITATTNDTAGVTWTAACGTVAPTSSLTGVAVVYTAPATVPTPPTCVITATSVSDTSITATATFTITTSIVVTLSTPPPSSMAPSATANITATVANDTGVADVTWSCTPVNTCGSFNPTQTGSGYATVYTAPATTGIVVITATSVTDTTKSASATINITSAASGTLAAGNYVFSLSGSDANFDPYSVSGVFTLASDGSITGEQDFVDYTYGSLYDAISSPSGSVSPPDAAGNLIITLNTGDICIGPGAGDSTCSGTGTETLVATLVSNSKAVVAEYDTWATSSGTLDLQDSTAAAATPSGGYAFYLSGVDYTDCPLAIGGVINVDGGTSNPGQISGTGSIFDANDCGSGSTYAGETFVANDNTVSAPDPLGRVTFTLNPTDPTGQFLQIVLVGYIVDATHIRLVESLDANFSITGGTAFGQGSNTGNFSSVSGNSYVVGLAGFNGLGVFQAAGLLTAGDTTFSGVVNYNDLTGTPGTVQSPDPVTEGTDTYTVDSTGRVSIPGMTDGVAGGASFNLQLYLDGNGHALAITLDDNDAVAGLAYQQTGGGSFTAASFDGTYAMNVFGADWNFEDELDSVGPIAADGIGTFTGSVDLNWIFNTGPTGDLPVSGTFTAAASGVFSSTTAAGSGITGLDLILGASQQDAFAYYLIDPTKVLAIETDPNQLTLGVFLLQQ